MGRRPDWIEARKAIPRATVRAVLSRAEGRCEKCGLEFGDNCRHEINHVLPVALGGSNDLENLEAICPDCHRSLTQEHVKIIAKCDRAGGRSGQYARRQKNGSRLRSRGFDKRFRRKMDGTVERRDVN